MEWGERSWPKMNAISCLRNGRFKLTFGLDGI